MDYVMKARTVNDPKEWFAFSIKDVPTVYNVNQFALLAKPNTPLLCIDEIRRGDSESGLFEGDVFEAEGCRWLVCYERGFYAINEEYLIRYLYTFKDVKVIGDYLSTKFPISINFRVKQLFKYEDKIFRLNDVVGIYQGKLLLRSSSQPIDANKINQECCISYEGKRLYLGDLVNGKPCELRGGRVTIKTEDGYLDLSTGGVLDGYNP